MFSLFYAAAQREYDKNNSSGWIYSVWKSFTYGIHEFLRSWGSAKLNKIPHFTWIDHLICQ